MPCHFALCYTFFCFLVLYISVVGPNVLLVVCNKHLLSSACTCVWCCFFFFKDVISSCCYVFVVAHLSSLSVLCFCWTLYVCVCVHYYLIAFVVIAWILFFWKCTSYLCFFPFPPPLADLRAHFLLSLICNNVSLFC